MEAILGQLVADSRAREARDEQRAEMLLAALATQSATLATLVRDMQILLSQPQRASRMPEARVGVGSAGGSLRGGGGGGGGGGGASGGSPQPSPLASTPRSGFSTPRSPQRSPTHAAAALAVLRTATSAARAVGAASDLSGISLPCSARDLIARGVRFAHRVGGKGAPGDGKDFGVLEDGATTMLLPPGESGKAGMSFFITSAETSEALQAAHAFHGAGSCIAYPLASLPAGMALQADKFQPASEDAASAPIMLHASLSTIERMPWLAFCTAMAAWEGRQVCLLAGAGAEGGLGAQGAAGAAGALGAAASSGCYDATADLLKRAALSLADFAAAAPGGGSPGM